MSSTAGRFVTKAIRIALLDDRSLGPRYSRSSVQQSGEHTIRKRRRGAEPWKTRDQRQYWLQLMWP